MTPVLLFASPPEVHDTRGAGAIHRVEENAAPPDAVIPSWPRRLHSRPEWTILEAPGLRHEWRASVPPARCDRAVAPVSRNHAQGPRMAFPGQIVAEAWAMAMARCECTRTSHDRLGKCTQMLKIRVQGEGRLGGWEAHHIDPDGPGTLSNCEILCQKCHKATLSYGRP